MGPKWPQITRNDRSRAGDMRKSSLRLTLAQNSRVATWGRSISRRLVPAVFGMCQT